MEEKTEDQQVDRLTFIANNPKLKEQLEELILMPKTYEERGEEPLVETIEKVLSENTKELCEKWETDIETLMLYLTLDAGLYDYIRQFKDRNLLNRVMVKSGTDGTGGPFDGGRVEAVYGMELTDIMEFAEKHLDLLPHSTQTLIKKHQRWYLKKPEMYAFTNEFEMKVYMRILPENFEEDTMMAHLMHFSWIFDGYEQVMTHYYFIKAIRLKYKETDTGKLDSLIDAVYGHFESHLKRNDDKNWMDSKYKSGLIEVFNLDGDFASELLNHTPKKETREIIEGHLEEIERKKINLEPLGTPRSHFSPSLRAF